MPLPDPDARAGAFPPARSQSVPPSVNADAFSEGCAPPDRPRDTAKVDWSIDWGRQSSLPPQTTATVLGLADRCLEINDQMDNFVGGRAKASLLAHPAFVALVREFASRFTLLVTACDAMQVENLPWRYLIADARLLAALEAGLEAEQRFLRDKAAAKFLAENPGFLQRP